ncbi:HAD superfamily hydrolase [Halanaeroarchaeum sp. HSR-CO]|uniref:HAD family hydrolase n=1 Tax=Halanaeroarchaeum sp. HSR-CO TaxID=2866382 RepID=UPI00217E7F5F|nr:HAD family hydrolase [Halanaeroarchaeum sp. HSR-CO]UWG48245.1 HAD superfamily hydrolase [Halanaeroarchaeum sp. HSR-CO]
MHVVFDLDGVLLDSESNLSWLDRAMGETLEAVGLEDTEENRASLFPPTEASIRSVADAAGVPVERLWTIRNRRYIDAKLAAMESGTIGPYPDADVVPELADRYPLGIISNSPQVVVETFVEQVALDGVFEVLVGRGTALADVSRLKPDTHLYDRLHEQTTTDEYVYVGDQESDRRFAERTGMAFIHLDRERGPTRTLYDVRDRLAEY